MHRMTSPTDRADGRPATFTETEVVAALSTGTDDIVEAVDDGLRDAINLRVSATIGYVCGEPSDLRDIAGSSCGQNSCGQNLDPIPGWITVGPR